MRLLAVIFGVVVLCGGVVFLATGKPPPTVRATPSPQDEAPRLDDASGLVVHEGRLWLVGNKNPSDNTLFSISLLDLWLQDGHATPLPHLLEQEAIRPKKAEQLEDVDVLSGQIIALSEDRRKVYSKGRALLDYSDIKSLAHKDSRGLEGLAVREVEHHPWQVAVLWEGGQQGDLQRSPLIVFHGVPRELVECGGTLCLDKGSVNPVVLEQKTLQKILDTDSAVRAPALVWIRFPRGTAETEPWGFLVLLSTESSGKWLLRVGVRKVEKGVGQKVEWEAVFEEPPLPLTDVLGSDLVKWNWEGLCWLDQRARRVALVNDEGQHETTQPPSVVPITLPTGW